MIKNIVSRWEAVDLLNQMLALDPAATQALIESRVPCNKALADHPLIQVRLTPEGTTVGLLGVLNGFFGIDQAATGGDIAIYAHYSDGVLTRFAQRPAND